MAKDIVTRNGISLSKSEYEFDKLINPHLYLWTPSWEIPVKISKYRTDKERVFHCNRAMGIMGAKDATLIVQELREYGCGRVKEPYSCPSCLQRRQGHRWHIITERINSAEEMVVYISTIKTKMEMTNLRRSCSYHGYQYLSIPTEDGGKVVVTTGEVKGSIEMNKAEAALYLGSFSGVVNQGRMTGKLGRENNEESESEKVIVNTRELVCPAKKIEGDILENANLIVAYKMVLTPEYRITEDNVQALMTRKENILAQVLLEYGYETKFLDPKPISVELEAVNKLFLRIVGGYEIEGSLNGYSAIARRKAEEMKNRILAAVSEETENSIVFGDVNDKVYKEYLDEIKNGKI